MKVLQNSQLSDETNPIWVLSPVRRVYCAASQKYSNVSNAPSSEASVADARKRGSGTFCAGPSADAGTYSVGSGDEASVVSSSSGFPSASLEQPARTAMRTNAVSERAWTDFFGENFMKAPSMSS